MGNTAELDGFSPNSKVKNRKILNPKSQITLNNQTPNNQTIKRLNNQKTNIRIEYLCLKSNHMAFTYLALGDSYTIGEQVPVFESFPYQTIQLLRKQFSDTVFHAAEIIAKTGWTTDELLEGIVNTKINEAYDWVSLLIGVNNQYRGRDLANYREELTLLMDKAIAFAGHHPEKVFVLGIPDWGVTPFAEGRDRAQIASDIDAYNKAVEDITQSKGCHFIELTTSQRKDGDKKEFLAGDGLHPSGLEYQKWAIALSHAIAKQL
jgi:lysophospholipase L1-like esterase